MPPSHSGSTLSARHRSSSAPRKTNGSLSHRADANRDFHADAGSDLGLLKNYRLRDIETSRGHQKDFRLQYEVVARQNQRLRDLFQHLERSRIQRPAKTPPPSRPAVPVSPAPQGAKFKALIIGVNYAEQGQKVLDGPSIDVDMLKRFIELQGWPMDLDHFRILHESESRKPTQLQILDSMRWLMSNVQPGDSRFFAFSGHAARHHELTGNPGDGMEEVLVTLDGKPLTHSMLIQNLLSPLPHGARLTGLIEAAHIGTLCELPVMFQCLQGNVGRVPIGTGSTAGGEAIFLTSCSDAKTGGARHGRVGEAISAFINTLCQSGGRVTYSELLQGMENHLKRQGWTTVPRLYSATEMDVHRSVSLTPQGSPLSPMPAIPETYTAAHGQSQHSYSIPRTITPFSHPTEPVVRHGNGVSSVATMLGATDQTATRHIASDGTTVTPSRGWFRDLVVTEVHSTETRAEHSPRNHYQTQSGRYSDDSGDEYH